MATPVPARTVACIPATARDADSRLRWACSCKFAPERVAVYRLPRMAVCWRATVNSKKRIANSSVASILRAHLSDVRSSIVTGRSLSRRAVLLILLGGTSLCTPAASELIPPGLYEVTTQTSMPHLEED